MRDIVTARPDAQLEQFRASVIDGLGATEKWLSSRYFYDTEGDLIFQKIMEMPEYYLTRAEEEIFLRQTDALIDALVDDRQEFDLIELGAGDGIKTHHLLRRMLERNRHPFYRPIDISANALQKLAETLRREMPNLHYRGEQGEYFDVLKRASRNPGVPRLVLFLGSNIGNLPRPRAIELLCLTEALLGPADRVLVGFDLKKDPHVILRAYDDPQGHTRDFNLNLLRRINRELGGDFNPGKFIHTAVYNPMQGSALSYLVSTHEQVVHIAGAERPFHFRAWESIHTELSQKYDVTMIEDMASEAGLRIQKIFFDQRNYFADVVFTPE